MARDGEVVVDCEVVRKLLLEDCALATRAKAERELSIARSSLSRMMFGKGSVFTPSQSATISDINARKVVDKANNILKRDPPIKLDYILWKAPKGRALQPEENASTSVVKPLGERVPNALVTASLPVASVAANAHPLAVEATDILSARARPVFEPNATDPAASTVMLALRRGPLNWHVPRAPDPYVEPADDFATVLSMLASDNARPAGIAGSRAAGLVGMGGIGKTVLAAALARDPRALQVFSHGTVWLSFGQDADLLVKQDELLMAISGVRHASRNVNEAHGALCLLTEQLPGRLLVVLDDVWTDERVRIAFGDLPNVQLLVTSRYRRVLEAFGAAPLELSLLSPDTAVSFLAAVTGRDRTDLPSESGEVIRRCGRLPIALAAAGSLIRRKQYTWSEIVEALVQARLHEFESKWLDEPLKRDLAAVLKVSVDALNDDERECLLDFAVLQEDVAVPEVALVNLWSGSRRPKPIARTIAREMASRSLLQIDGELRYRVHDLYRDYLRDRQEISESTSVVGFTVPGASLT